MMRSACSGLSPVQVSNLVFRWAVFGTGADENRRSNSGLDCHGCELMHVTNSHIKNGIKRLVSITQRNKIMA